MVTSKNEMVVIEPSEKVYKEVRDHTCHTTKSLQIKQQHRITQQKNHYEFTKLNQHTGPKNYEFIILITGVLILQITD